jgi:hypothetical protein
MLRLNYHTLVIICYPNLSPQPNALNCSGIPPTERDPIYGGWDGKWTSYKTSMNGASGSLCALAQLLTTNKPAERSNTLLVLGTPTNCHPKALLHFISARGPPHRQLSWKYLPRYLSVYCQESQGKPRTSLVACLSSVIELRLKVPCTQSERGRSC